MRAKLLPKQHVFIVLRFNDDPLIEARIKGVYTTREAAQVRVRKLEKSFKSTTGISFGIIKQTVKGV